MSFEDADFQYLMETRTGAIDLTFEDDLEVHAEAASAPTIQ
jgi:hypothetical protein